MSNQFSNQRCSKCYQKYSGLKATCSDSSCNREHLFKKNGQLFCVVCLMREGNIKCQKCRKSITCLEEMGKWRGNVFSSDDHTYDINNFGCECRECNHGENKKSKLKRCQGTFSVDYNGGHKAKYGSTQFNQCDSAVPIDGGDFCQQCQGQTETYQQLKVRLDAEHKRIFEEYRRAREKAQNWWNTLSSSDPHLVPIQITDEFLEKEIGFRDNLALEMIHNQQMVVRKNNNDNSSPLADNPVSPTQPPQPENNQRTDEKNHNDGQKSLENRDKSEKKKIEVGNENKDNKLIIDLKNVKKITLREDGKLEIEFNNSENGNYSISQIVTDEQISNNQELQKIKNYCQEKGKTSLEQQELNSLLSVTTPEKPRDGNNSLLIISIFGGTLIVGIVIGLFWRKKKR
ncbi:31481_t:CDS:2 [Racocetra persica]|uniref:31481_t:CDS:1 n=1 Tax=Racocetra persica TaxID=160502 RepID=A0ACA9MGP7_9GLOM|nr:31481_t:CDS:2 [Racocetra persica]